MHAVHNAHFKEQCFKYFKHFIDLLDYKNNKWLNVIR